MKRRNKVNQSKEQNGQWQWASLEHLRKQYKAVPEKDYDFSGHGGFPVAWDRSQYEILIDSSDRCTNSNYCVVGVERSGKDESFVLPTIDICSRASEKANLIITDPHLEVYRSTKETLETRGYKCVLLNAADPLKSMKYNPLQPVLDAWKRGDYAMAETYADFLGKTIFLPDEPKAVPVDDRDSEFWDVTSAELFSAMALALVSDCVQLDKEENEKEKLAWKQRRARYDALNDEEKEAVRSAHKGDSYRDVILERDTPIEDDEAFAFQPRYRHEKEATIYSIYVNLCTLATAYIGENKTCLDVYFEKRPLQDRARLKYGASNLAAYRTKRSICASAAAKLFAFSDEAVAKMTSSTDCSISDILHSERPCAVFLSMSLYDTKNWPLSKIFLRQLMYELDRERRNAPSSSQGASSFREIVFLLNDFCEIGTLDRFDSYINAFVGTSVRNVRFLLVLSSFESLKSMYGEDRAREMLNYCTVAYTYVWPTAVPMPINAPIMDSLRDLGESENVVIAGKTKIRNTENQRFKYSYHYLADTFKVDTIWYKWGQVMPDNSSIDLRQYTYDINAHFDRLSAEERAAQAAREQVLRRPRRFNQDALYANERASSSQNSESASDSDLPMADELPQAKLLPKDKTPPEK